MMGLLAILKRIWGLVASSGLFWKVLKNWTILSESLKGIETVLHNLTEEKRALPNHDEAVTLLHALSNILKTGVIDIPGVDEYKIALNLDEVASSYTISIEDAKNEKYLELPSIKKVPVTENKTPSGS